MAAECYPQDEPLHARAKKMRSTDNNMEIRYEGNAVLWQGANRLEADVVQIDRENNLLAAHGNVRSQLLDKAQDSAKSGKTTAPAGKGQKPAATKPALSVFTIVRAPELNYDDNKRLARYSGGAVLERPSMTVKGREIQAFLRNDSNDSSLDHALADGKVDIHQVSPERTRDASSEHAEYYVDKDEVILEGGKPTFIDSLRGTTTGRKLTWFSEDDRLLVDGVEKQPVQTVHPAQEQSNYPVSCAPCKPPKFPRATVGRKVVDNVSLWVKQGEVVGLLGPNGAGKTTSFYMIVGLISPDSGRVQVSNGEGSKTSPTCRCTSAHGAASAICRKKPRSSAS